MDGHVCITVWLPAEGAMALAKAARKARLTKAEYLRYCANVVAGQNHKIDRRLVAWLRAQRHDSRKGEA